MVRSIALSAVAALALAVSVVAAQPAAADADDSAAPVATFITVVPTSIDDSAADGHATLDLRIADTDGAGNPGSGFDHGTIVLSNGAQSLDPIDFNTAQSVNGTPTDATYDIDVPIAQGTAPGTYFATSITLVDADGNGDTTSDTSAPLTVLRTPDTTAPALAGTVSAGPSPVDVTQGSQDVTYSAHLTDDVSGVADATLYVQRPDGYGIEVDLGRASGTASDGVWTGTATFSPFGDEGVYTPTELVVHDADGNTLDRTDGLGGTVTVTRTPDDTGPDLVAVTPTPAAVDVTTGDAVATLAVQATDDHAGVESGSFTFSSPDGAQSTWDGDLAGAPAKGSATDGTWHVPVRFPARSAFGTWTLTSATLTDAQGNSTTYGLYGETPPSAHVKVTDAADGTPPALTAFSVGPARVGTLYGDGTASVVGHLSVTDDVSGFSSATITFRGPDGTVSDDATTVVDYGDGATTGTSRNGSVAFTASLPATDGAWTVDTVTLTDLAGNSRSYATAALGSQTGVVVDTTSFDAQPPTLTSLAFAPATVNTASGAAPVTLTAGFSDPDTTSAGVVDGSVLLSSPSGRDTLEFDLGGDGAVPATGDVKTGTYVATASVGRYVERGTWHVAAVTLTDAAGNTAALAPSDVSSALHGSVPTLTVTAAADTVAPTLTAVAAAAPSVDVTDDAPLVVHVTGSDATGGSGFATALVTVTGPNGRTASGTQDVAVPAASGSVDVTVPVPHYNSSGSWTVTGVSVTDVAGNSRTYAAADLTSFGGNRTVSVTGAATDTDPPNASVPTLTPSTVDTTGGPVDVDVLVHLTDAASGVTQARLGATSPHGIQTLAADLQLIGGTAADGWWQGTLSFGHYVDAGTWTVGPLAVTDAAGNTRTVTSTDLGPAATMGVAGPAPTTPAAPSVETAMLSGATGAVVTWTAPDDDGGVPINGYVVTPYVGTVASPATLVPVGTRATVTGLAKNTTYTFRVAATNALGAGAASGNSDPVTVPATAPGAPTAVVATAGPTGTTSSTTTATVSWTAPVDGGGLPISSYTVTGSPGGACRTSATSCTVGGLVPGAPYSFTVTASNSKGAGPASAASPTINSPITRPGAPTIGTATVAGSTSATLSWTPPAAAGGSPITGYTITPYIGTSAKTATAVGTVTSATVTGLAKSATYTFKVAATNAAGTGAQSAASNAVTVSTTVPGAPVIGTAAPSGATGALVRWAAPADLGGSPITGYVVTPYLGSTALAATTVGVVTSTTITGLTKSATYTFTVQAINAVGTGAASDPSNSVTVASTVPDAPTIGTATLSGGTGATVAWTPGAAGGTAVTGYVITPYVGTSAQPATTVAAPASSATITGLAKGRSYTFVVAATNALGTGARSAASIAVAVPTTVPGAPAIGTAAASGATGALVHWSAPTDPGGTALTGYVVTPYLGTSAQPATTVGVVTSTTITGLAKGSTYTFTVKALNAMGSGPASAASNSVAVPTTVPDAPTIGTATLTGGTGATVTWTPGAAGGTPITGYVITPYVGTSAQPATTVAAPASSATITGLAKGKSYTFVVAATNTVGTSARSAASSVVSVPATLPGAPVIGPATGSGQSVVVRWSAPADPGGSPITGYTVTGAPGGSCTSTGTSCTVSGLVPGGTYTFTVTATNAVGTGPASAASNAVTTANTVPGAPTAVTATPAGSTAVTVSWTAPVNSGGTPITGYVVTPYVGTVAKTRTTVGAVTSTTITGLTTGVAYTFTVAAGNAVGTGAQSAASAAATPARPAVDPPAAPTAVSALAGNGTAVVRWSAPATDGGAAITGYTVTGAPGGSCTTATSTCTVSGLRNGTAYTFAVTATNSAGPGPASAPSAAVTPVVPMRLVLGSAPTTVAYGSAAVLTGTLTRTDTGAVVAGQRITLQYRKKGSTGAFTTSATAATTGAAGTVSFKTFKPGYSVEVRLVAPAAGAYGPATSASRAVTVVRTISIGRTSMTAKTHRSFTVSGALSPAKASVGVYLQRRSGTRWVTVGSTHSRAHGAYSFAIKAGGRATYAYRVYTRSDTSFGTSISATKTVRVS